MIAARWLLAVALLPAMALAQSPPPASAPPAPVSVAPVTRRDVPVFLRGLGTAQAQQSVLVRARVDGTLDSIAFTEGQAVKQGDLLAQIDPRPYQAVLDQAQAKRAAEAAQLANARLDLGRSQSLMQGNFASRQSVDTLRAQVAQLEAQLRGDDATVAAAQLNVDFTRITAPVGGRVGLRLVDPGNVIRAADATGIVTISQIQPIAALFTVPQDNLPAITAAMRARTLPVLAYSADNHTLLDRGALVTIDNSIDPATGTIRLKATFPNAEETLWPGQFVNLRLLIDTLHDALTVPSAAIQHGPAGLYVYVLKPDATAAVQPVRVTQDDGQIAVVADGLADGAKVVTAGQSRLAAGSKVVVGDATGS